LLLLRVVTAAVVAVVGVLAWVIPFVELTETVVMMTVIAVAHAVFVAKLRSRTQVLPEGVLGADIAPAG
jgi:membrane protein implicated in regulation of membrane protease activity